MKKLLKIASICLIITLLTLTLAACAPSKSEVSGKYIGSYIYNGNAFSAEIVLREDGTYSRILFKNDYVFSMDSGNYTIKGKEIILETDDLSSIGYNYSNGKLENGGHIFIKNK